MAKILTNSVTISVSKVAKDDTPESVFITDAVKAEIEQVLAAILGDGFVIEVN